MDATELDAMRATALRLLARWAEASERWWHDVPQPAADAGPAFGCYGTGFDWWGVQTNLRYAAAMATLAVHGGDVAYREHTLQRALAALRFGLASHVSNEGGFACTDGRRWGHSWITPLGVERLMHGVHAIREHLTADDHAALRRVITSEAEWCYRDHRRGEHHGVFGDVWNSSGKNAPESNVWNGALLWRAAAMYPDHADAEVWRERAHEFLINGVSVEGDASDGTVVAGRPVRAWFRGANFFPSFALDHHGYLNVGYMAICVSNAAMLHFDLRAAKLPRPASLDHHQDGLWDALRRMTFADGRLARIGGDSRLRYTYCQEYLLPSLLYAADQLGDQHALALAKRQLDLVATEADHAGDGSFYGKRLASLAESNPYYYTRLESDRACALSMLVAYLPLVRETPAVFHHDFEGSARDPWIDRDHGAVLRRDPHRLASFAWRAYGYTQGLCVPPGRSDLAEWEQNLAGRVRFLEHPDAFDGGQTRHRRLLTQHLELFDGGFVTCGAVMEGCNLSVAEGWSATDSATHWLAFAALPDGHTVVGVQLCRAAARRVYTREISGLLLGIPNDLYNGFERQVESSGPSRRLGSPPERDEALVLDSRWANIDGVLGVVGLYGAESLSIDRSRMRRGGKFHSLFVDEVCWKNERGVRSHESGATLLDVGWAVVSGVAAAQTRAMAEHAETRGLLFDQPNVRGVSVMGVNGHRHAMVANFGDTQATVKLPSGRSLTIAPGRATVV